MKFTHYKTRADEILMEEKHDGEAYREIIRRNKGEVQEREIYSLYADPVKQTYRDIAREQGWPDPFPPSGASGTPQGPPVT